MIASLHVADIGVVRSLRMRPPSPEAVTGLLDARSGLTARFTRSLRPDPAWGRAMWLGFWDDEASLDQFLGSDDPLVEMFDGGWTLRMVPLRGHGSWPGFPVDLAEPGPGAGPDEPVVVLTLGLLRLRRAMAWTRASNRVQKQFLATPGVIWAMGASRPPYFAATMSLWESAATAAAFAHQSGEAHATAIGENADDPFMRQEIFARFRPLSSSGSLGPTPELAGDWLTSRTGESR